MRHPNEIIAVVLIFAVAFAVMVVDTSPLEKVLMQ